MKDTSCFVEFEIEKTTDEMVVACTTNIETTARISGRDNMRLTHTWGVGKEHTLMPICWMGHVRRNTDNTGAPAYFGRQDFRGFREGDKVAIYVDTAQSQVLPPMVHVVVMHWSACSN